MRTPKRALLSWAFSGAIGVIALVLALSSMRSEQDKQSDDAGREPFSVAPGGTGDCSTARPCGSIHDALSRARAGQIIELVGGSYPKQEITGSNSWPTNVVVQPAAGAKVELAGLDIDSPHVTFRGLQSQGATLNDHADGGRFENMIVRGSTFILQANDISISHSRLGPSPGNDTLKIGPLKPGAPVPTNIIVEDSELGPALLTDPEQHDDTIQSHGAANLIIRRNVIHEAASQTIILGEELGPNSNILVENNIIEQCSPQREDCGAFYATSGAGTNVRFVHNTIKGAIYPENTSAYQGNIIEYAYCSPDSSLTYNLLATVAEGSSACGSTNRVGTATYREDGHHLAPGSPGIDIGGPAPPDDIDGDSRNGAADAGADEFVDRPD